MHYLDKLQLQSINEYDYFFQSTSNIEAGVAQSV
jgi:hypothetical protein